MIVVGGVIPDADHEELRAAGADAIYPPGTVIPEAACGLIETLRTRLSEAEAADSADADARDADARDAEAGAAGSGAGADA